MTVDYYVIWWCCNKLKLFSQTPSVWPASFEGNFRFTAFFPLLGFLSYGKFCSDCPWWLSHKNEFYSSDHSSITKWSSHSRYKSVVLEWNRRDNSEQVRISCDHRATIATGFIGCLHEGFWLPNWPRQLSRDLKVGGGVGKKLEKCCMLRKVCDIIS